MPLDAGEKYQLTTHKIKGQASLTELLKGIKMRHLIHGRNHKNLRCSLTQFQADFQKLSLSFL
jgi:hypothetical protein